MANSLRRQVYAGLLEILKDDSHYYNGISKGHFTEKGLNELHQFMAMVGPRMLQVHEDELRAKAKQMVVEELGK